MKTFSLLAIAASAQEQDKKVPPRHPLQRLNKLRMFAEEWCNDNLTAKQAAHWIPKFKKNVVRFERRYEICGFYDENQKPHGGPKPVDNRRRRDADSDYEDEDGILMRYDKENVIKGIKQISSGFRKWAQRYIVDCKVQPGTQANRADKWFGILAKKWTANQ